jgi:3-hydroxybutyryl-CoA dehydrogenase
MRKIKMMSIGALGAGIMGNGIAQISAMAEYEVILYDIDQNFIDRGFREIEKSLTRMVKKNKIVEGDIQGILTKIKPSLNLQDFKSCDMIIEAIPENIELKKDSYSKLDQICQSKTIFASNTSAISITDLASSVSKERQSRFIGLHFFNPVTMMKLVEVIRAETTSDRTCRESLDYCKKIGKETVLINDLPGFVTTRLVASVINEAVFILQDGLGNPKEIDKAIKLGLAHPMGPLFLADLIGLDTILHILDYLSEELDAVKFKAAPLMRKMVRAGKLGRKSGEGFYKY